MNTDDIFHRCAPMLTKQKFFTKILFYHNIFSNLSSSFMESHIDKNYNKILQKRLTKLKIVVLLQFIKLYN